ncbi:MAG: hypothetical protein AAGE84_21540 [Cyanobacteria bacterium P01_G01_bin.39]
MKQEEIELENFFLQPDYIVKFYRNIEGLDRFEIDIYPKIDDEKLSEELISKILPRGSIWQPALGWYSYVGMPFEFNKLKWLAVGQTSIKPHPNRGAYPEYTGYIYSLDRNGSSIYLLRDGLAKLTDNIAKQNNLDIKNICPETSLIKGKPYRYPSKVQVDSKEHIKIQCMILSEVSKLYSNSKWVYFSTAILEFEEIFKIDSLFGNEFIIGVSPEILDFSRANEILSSNKFSVKQIPKYILELFADVSTKTLKIGGDTIFKTFLFLLNSCPDFNTYIKQISDYNSNLISEFEEEEQKENVIGKTVEELFSKANCYYEKAHSTLDSKERIYLFSEAREIFEEVISMDYTNGKAYYYLGAIYFKTDIDKAKKFYTKATEQKDPVAKEEAKKALIDINKIEKEK